MRIGMLMLISIMLSGCFATSKGFVTPCSVNDYLDINKGSVITGVVLPTDESKTYNIVTPKEGYWSSLECDNRRQKGK